MSEDEESAVGVGAEGSLSCIAHDHNDAQGMVHPPVDMDVDVDEPKIKLITAEKEALEVPVSVCKRIGLVSASVALDDEVEDDCEVPLPSVPSWTLTTIISFIEMHMETPLPEIHKVGARADGSSTRTDLTCCAYVHSLSARSNSTTSCPSATRNC
jgi:hypothetical protein